MTPPFPTHPAPGCIVEFLQGNAAQIAIVLENQNGRLRVLTPNRREIPLPETRLLPWIGPQAALAGREDAVSKMNAHSARRDAVAKLLRPMDWWEFTQGEMQKASAEWFAELSGEDMDIDLVAACGHVLLDTKTHFRFQPPDFEILDAACVEQRMHAKAAEEARERLAKQGAAFFHALWECFCKHMPPPSPEALKALDPEVLSTLKDLLLRLIVNPDQQSDVLWKAVSKGLPDDPNLALHLAQTWGLVGPHHNIWLDRAGYDAGDSWADLLSHETSALVEASTEKALPLCELPFISIDNASTRDIDDAFSITTTEDGWKLTLALACPACSWEFGSELDTAVRNRATSIYLPEATYHMLPENLGTAMLSLVANEARPALIVAMDISSDGTVRSCIPSSGRVRICANLTYDDAEAALDGADTPAFPYRAAIQAALDLASARRDRRLANGAVIIERPELNIAVAGTIMDRNVSVTITPDSSAPRAHLLVAEQMIAANAALADWAVRRDLPLIFRGQDVRTTDDISGIWTNPVQVAAVVRQLAPAIMDTKPHRHVGVGEEKYAPITSPLRRYPDLFNESQILKALDPAGKPLSKSETDTLLTYVNTRLDAASMVQRLRTRYWKFIYLRQHAGDFWRGVVTDVNDAFITVNIPCVQVIVRGRVQQFPPNTVTGLGIELRLGKINPILGDIAISETRLTDTNEDNEVES